MTLSRAGVVSAALVLMAFGCSTDESEMTVPSDTTTTAQPEVSTTLYTTPEPSAEQAATIEAGVAAVYPGVPEGKAADWARSTCSDKLRDGLDDAQQIARIARRFAGGDRPDPTVEQAEQIHAIVLEGGWCT